MMFGPRSASVAEGQAGAYRLQKQPRKGCWKNIKKKITKKVIVQSLHQRSTAAKTLKMLLREVRLQLSWLLGK